MTINRKILFLFLLAGISISAEAKKLEIPVDPFISELQEKTQTLEIAINGIIKIQMEKAPLEGYLEIYSILGVKVKSINLKSFVGGNYPIDLAKGLYILKAGKVAQKVIVR
ncbi:MAG: T9SS C-terminal target domain-containing protein [Dysgonomonas sp.]|nr:T9SS C-terminal target domain-containing protein [Dysgonomonas sp.]